MSFTPDPKPQKRVSSKSGEKLKSYSCKYCGEKYEMTAREYGSRSMGAAKRSCKSTECMKDAAMAFLESKKSAEKKEWKKRKEVLKKDVGKKVNLNDEPLQKAINKIARLLDKDQPCLARPFDRNKNFDGGHVIPKSRYLCLRYHLWNIHKQGKQSNRSQEDDMLMLEGIERRYGKERRSFLETLHIKYPILKLSTPEKSDALWIANGLIRDLEGGTEYTRDEVNTLLGIYKD